jgi:hypothetical protein
MQVVNEAQRSLFSAVHSIFGYYQALLNPHSEVSALPEYDLNTLHCVNLFLKENNYVRFSIDGTLIQVEPYLPNDILLSKLIANFMYSYSADNLASTQEQLKVLATLPANKKRPREAVTKIPGAEHYMGYFSLNTTREKLEVAQDKIDQTPPMKQTRIQQYNPVIQKKSKVRDWSESEFVRSIRLIYNFYKARKPYSYNVSNIFGAANLKQFSSGSGKKCCYDVLAKFNSFLIKNNFITQTNNVLHSIAATDKVFPAQDEELLKLLRQFKQDYYKKQLPSKFALADSQQHLAIPAAAGLPNKAALSFIIDELDENSVVPRS